jgi:hypothetical protein
LERVTKVTVEMLSLVLAPHGRLGRVAAYGLPIAMPWLTGAGGAEMTAAARV